MIAARDKVRLPTRRTRRQDQSPLHQRIEGRTDKCAPPGMQAASQIMREELSAQGAPLDPATQSEFAHLFQHDFSSVRVHTGARAGASAEALGASAYAVGRHIVFGNNQYAPALPAGRKLIAHELAHVVQQGGATSVPAAITMSASPETESSAEVAATSALSGHGVSITATNSVCVSRKEAIPKADEDVTALTTTDRLASVVLRSGKHLGPAFKSQLEELVTPESLSMFAAFASAGLVAQATPAGLLADVIAGGLLIATLIGTETSVRELISTLIEIVKIANEARSGKDLERAAVLFGNVIAQVGLSVVVALLSHGVSKALGAKSGSVGSEGEPAAREPSTPAGGQIEVIEHPTGRPKVANASSEIAPTETPAPARGASSPPPEPQPHSGSISRSSSSGAEPAATETPRAVAGEQVIQSKEIGGFSFRTLERAVTQPWKSEVIQEASGRLIKNAAIDFKADARARGRFRRSRLHARADDVGHLIAKLFGGPAVEENLSMQNRIANESGTWRSLERTWAERLSDPNVRNIEITVRDIYKKGAERPYKRLVEWTETYADKTQKQFNQADEMGQVLYGNFPSSPR